MKGNKMELKNISMILFVGLILAGCNMTGNVVRDSGIVVIETNMGNIEVELNSEKAPITVENFLKYVDDGFYENTIFHRVIEDFMIQGGGFTTQGHQKETREPIKNEAANGLRNDRGTIAMARTQVVDSATAQFFINHADNDFLNHRDTSIQGYGYAVFGKVISGMDIVDEIAGVATYSRMGMADWPVEEVVIQRIYRR